MNLSEEFQTSNKGESDNEIEMGENLIIKRRRR